MKTKLIILTAFLALTTVSCSKYEDGPAISLRSKTQRVANTWKIENAYRNGEDVTSDYDQYVLTLRDDNTARLVAIYTSGVFSVEVETNGTWTFEDKKEVLVLNFEDDAADGKYLILRLKEKELWLREVGGDDELHLIPN